MSKARSNTVTIYLAALLCLIAAGLYLFSKSDFFSVKEVKINGSEKITHDEVLQLLGTVKGENIFLTDKKALAMKIELHPLVDNATVTKKLPATIIVQIQERLPAALILNGEGVVEVDSQAVILKFYDSWPTTDTPVLTGIAVPETIGPGQKINDANLTKALQLLGQAPKDLLPLIGELHYISDGQFNIYLSSGTEVKLGFDDDYTEKLTLLKKLLDSKDYDSVQNKIKYIDLTSGKPVLGR
ncbi:FtsQ-type POTRA domain-containing protein [Dehalobacter sp. DCM]|uniref:cell division protein FtsQ/DivIB n=1 Tax=Dehalobacter sp. DCM TaxID=2907827 RepID=UPI003081C490|nr:FtsQ-type POTRA domain-containing protein [Dehalobacter sp. DCM]